MIGSKLYILHENEIDFSRSSISVGGVLLGHTEPIRWFLLTDRKIPERKCADDLNCIASLVTETGYADFGTNVAKREGIYYVCAKINGSSLDNKSSQISSADERDSWCSNGFVVDDTPPVKGHVSIKANEAGYTNDGSEMYITWNGFTDNNLGHMIGYNKELVYQYAIGTYPFGEDVVMCTNTGHSTSVIARNLRLRPGQQYYATVKARDAVGLETKSTSQAVLLDNTPPSPGTIRVGDIHRSKYILSNNSLVIHWMGFSDSESGIQKVELGVGTHPYVDDVVTYSLHEKEFAEIAGIHFQDGHIYYATLKVQNRAGLFSVVVSDVFIIDSSPPSLGVVMDGVTSDIKPFDVDFQMNTSSIMAYWTGFTDPHSGISHYKVGLGTELGSTNVKEMTYVGLQTLRTWHSDFTPGTKYYVVVEACNGALLCKRVTSNGIIVDNSPPVPGLVFVGGAIHSKYIPHRTHLHIEWVGFEDLQSEIDHFEVCVSSFNNSCDVMDFMNVLLASSMIPKRLTLPIGCPLHVIVRAYNRVGLHADRISDSFMVDLTPPTLIQNIQFLQIVNGNMTTVSSQWDPSYISVAWSFEDKESPITEQTLWIATHRGGHTAVESIDVRNSNSTTVIMKNILRSGDQYSATISACNSAGLCSSSIRKGLLLDSTPPTIGGFKPEMAWNNTAQKSEITLTWYGFNDAESGISAYFITIGQTYSGSELSDGIIRVDASENATEERHIFHINHTISTQQKVVLSIWAVNHVNMNSTIAKVTVLAVPEVVTGEYGVFMLERHSCDVDFCTKDCTCAVVGQKCVDIHINHSCKLVNESLNGFVIDIPSAYRIGRKYISISSACIESSWFTPSNLPSRYEWTIGVDGMKPGNGIFDSRYEKVWYDVGSQTNFRFCLPRKKSFLHDEHYVVYIRVWLSRTDYYIQTSDPILIDLTPPVVRRGQAVIDTSEMSCKVDKEFSNLTDTLTACWNKTFSDQQSGISHYYVSVGTVVEGDDVVKITDIGRQTSVTWSNLILYPGVKYYVTVTAVNTVGLSMRLSSDGILIDNERPIAGIVYNTQRHTSIHSQSNSVSFGASWHGFDDQHSYIKEYQVAIVRCKERYNIDPVFQSIGLRNNINVTGIQLIHGEHYCALLKAVDAAGYESFVSSSPPLLIDITPPTGYTCENFTTYLSHFLHPPGKTLKTTNFNMTFAPNTFYKFDIDLHKGNLESSIELQIEDFVTLLPITVEEGIKSSYLYLSSFDRQIAVSFTLHDFPIDTNGSIEISKCNKHSTSQETDQMIRISQISPTEVAICMRFVDLESKIRNIQFGYGTHRDGFQLKPFMSSSLLHHSIIETDVTHGSPLFVSISIENNAGLKYTIQPSSIVVDHTPPEIDGVKVTPRYDATTNVTMVTLDYHWTAYDKESTVRQCQVKIGTVRGAENILRWTNIQRNGTYQTPFLDVQHGDVLYTTIRCINSVNLLQSVIVGPIVLSYLPPILPDKEILILSQNLNSQYNTRQCSVQSNASSVMFFWDDFEDISSTVNYQCRLRHDDKVLLAWRDVFERNVCSFDDILLKGNTEYVVEVKGQNLNHHESGNLNSTLTIDSSKPGLTGQTVRMLKKNEDVCRITWKDCFALDVSLHPRFKLTVGRKEGQADIVKDVISLENVMDINCRNTNEIYIKVTATYITGESKSIVQKVLI